MYYLVQAGTSLQRLSTAGAITTLTLPTGVTLSATSRPRFAILNKQIVMAGSPSETLWIDRYNNVRRLALKPPITAPSIAATGSGVLTGSFEGKYTYIIVDSRTGQVVAESDYSPVSNESSVLAANQLQWNAIVSSNESAVTARRIYRTASGPTEDFFRVSDLQGNSATSFVDNVGDDATSTLAAPTDLGTPPTRLELLVEWKDHLWGKSYADIDNLVYSANRKHYAWPATNLLQIKPLGADPFGITGLFPRRDELGIAKRAIIWKLIGDPPNIRLVKLAENVGCLAPDSVVVIRDRAYWLWMDGVYTWDENGVSCITDDDVKPWFTTDDTFNRSRFPYAYGQYNPVYNTYELHLAEAGSTDDDVWISYDIERKKWLGPHNTYGFVPTAAALVYDSNGLPLPVLGDSDGYVWKQNQAGSSDNGDPIDFRLRLRHHCKTPDIEKVFLEMSLLTKQESAGQLEITPSLGWLDATSQTTITADLTLGRQRLRRISTSTQGTGKIVTLEFQNDEDAQDVTIYGYEIPFFERGRR